MNKNQFAKLCRQHGHRVYERGEETQLAPCPNCGNDPGNHGNWSARVGEGKYNAWCCQDSGRLQDFVQNYLGQDDVEIPVEVDESRSTTTRELELDTRKLSTALEVDSAKHYLFDRGVTAGQIIRHEISVYLGSTHPEYGSRLHGRIVVPVSEYWSGDPFGFVARTVRDQYPKYLNVFSERKIAGFRAQGRAGVHVLVEGVFDGLAVERAGFQAAVGFGQKPNNLELWADQMDPEHKAVVAYDGESAYGRRQAARIRPFRDVSVVDLPDGEDPASVGDEKLRMMIGEVL